MYKEYIGTLFKAIRGKNLPTSVKVLLGLGIAYIVSPVDIIPDLGLPIGLVDDTILAAILMGVGGKIIHNRIQNEKNNGDPNVDDHVVDI